MKTSFHINSKIVLRLAAAAVIVASALFASGCKNCAEPVKEPGCYLVTYEDYIFGLPTSLVTTTICTNTISSGAPALLIHDCQKVLHYERTGPIDTSPFPSDSSMCLQDDANPSNVLLINFLSGRYVWCCGLTDRYEGQSAVISIGESSLKLTASAGDRVFEATISRVAPYGGAATLKSQSGQTLCAITDTDYRTNDCSPCKP